MAADNFTQKFSDSQVQRPLVFISHKSKKMLLDLTHNKWQCTNWPDDATAIGSDTWQNNDVLLSALEPINSADLNIT